MPVLAHIKAQEAFHSVEMHTMATSCRLAGNLFRFSCLKAKKSKAKKAWETIKEGGGEIMKMKRWLMRQSRTTRDFSSHENPAHMNQAFGTAVTLGEGQNLPDTGVLGHISISAVSLLYSPPPIEGLQSLLKASANCQGEITYCLYQGWMAHIPGAL